MSATASSSPAEAGAPPPWRTALRRALPWLLALAAATAAMVPLRARLDKAHVTLVYLVLVLLASARAGRAVGLVLSVAAFLCFNFFFLPPYHTFVVADPLDWLVLLAALAVSTVAAQLLGRARAEAERANERAGEVRRLAALGAETLSAARAEDALLAIATVVRDAVGAERCDIYLREEGTGTPRLAATAPAGAPAPPREAAVAVAALKGLMVAERADGTATLLPEDGAEAPLPPARALSVPLRARDRVVGVLRVGSPAGLRMTPSGRRLFAALAYYAALGAERVRLSAEAERAQALREADRVKDAFLASVSHDLRTPLTTIKALAHAIAEEGEPRAEVIERESDRLGRFVTDLLDLSRLGAGALPLTLELVAAEDLVGAALQRVSGWAPARAVAVALPPSGPLLVGRMDFSHALRVLVNLLENAHKYAPPGTPVDLEVRRSDGMLEIAVADRGPGIPPEERDRVFQPFHRPAGALPDVGSAGLGLSIARGLAEAQGGAVTFAPRPGGGSVFTLALPAADLPPEAGDVFTTP